jgi:hypothetical protein
MLTTEICMTCITVTIYDNGFLYHCHSYVRPQIRCSAIMQVLLPCLASYFSDYFSAILKV